MVTIDLRGLPPVARVADLGGKGGALTAAAVADLGAAEVDVIDIDAKGVWGGGGEALRASVAAACPGAVVRLVGSPRDLRPCGLVLNVAMFGHSGRAARLSALLPALIGQGGLLVSDIRKGSGALPFLRGWGELTVLAEWFEGDDLVSRALIRHDPPPPPPPPPDEGDWGTIAQGLAGDGGFFRDGGGHSMLFVPRGPTLVVTFDNLDLAMERRRDRRPWGFGFIEKQGWSMLGVMADGWTWYRDPWVLAEFDRLRDTGFFAQFARVVFYGASMGGYAACAFVGACPGADVVAISPQSTLARDLVPWETRYRGAWGRDFSGPTGDAAVASRAAGRVILFYDPYEPLDAAHVARFDGPNVVRLRAPLMGHRLGSSLLQMGILNPLIVAALDGTLTEAAFWRALRARRDFPRYQRELFRRALARGRPGLARRVAVWSLARDKSRFFSRELARLDG